MEAPYNKFTPYSIIISYDRLLNDEDPIQKVMQILIDAEADPASIIRLASTTIEFSISAQSHVELLWLLPEIINRVEKITTARMYLALMIGGHGDKSKQEAIPDYIAKCSKNTSFRKEFTSYK